MLNNTFTKYLYVDYFCVKLKCNICRALTFLKCKYVRLVEFEICLPNRKLNKFHIF